MSNLPCAHSNYVVNGYVLLFCFVCSSAEGSAEEHRYVSALSKEKKAFESLIATKEHMVICLPDHPLDLQRAALQDKMQLSMDTRTGTGLGLGGGSSSSSSSKKGGPRAIVVDVREFRSTLPSELYAAGGGAHFEIVPRTLLIADYVLAPQICVERKGISDLFQSFASGRLYNQAEVMGRYYEHPCLLIEFSAEKSFALTAVNELTPDIAQNAISSRIVLLALSFPNLRMLWSR
jgi:DNA excision repair protein ERCC-4